ncbi:MAG: short-chain fatty acid transporter [Bacteroidetes bacterium]|nr:short-chain fatty acid transporter [Bacteroidota bacterium]
MMGIKSRRSFIPSPLTLAIVLSFVVYFFALIFTSSTGNKIAYPLQLLNFYQMGFWDLLAFAMQMMLILVLGNVLALTPVFQSLIKFITSRIKTATGALLLTTFFSLLLSYFNWGLGLIFSALLARSIAEHARQVGMKLNFPLLVGAAYSGMMVWHGGLSGSAPLKVAESNHFLENLMGVIPVNETIFSTMNLTLYASFLLIIPLTFLLLSKLNANTFTKSTDLPEPVVITHTSSKRQYLGTAFGIVLATIAIYQFYLYGLSALNINLINLILLALGLLLYANLEQFMKAVNSAISSSSGIMIQFPIYAGIMGLMKYSGLAEVFTQSMISISSPATLPIYGFFSAAVVNFFVPSGGGQWAVQGPILIEAAQQLGVSIPKTIMALAYGDQLTNMIQPFWAIPLISITGVKAKSIIPYTFVIMIVGGIASVAALYLF